jgi:hypothetical protein
MSSLVVNHVKYIYIYIYIYMCVCVCVCVYLHSTSLTQENAIDLQIVGRKL